MNILDSARTILQKEIDALQYELRVVLPEMIKKAVELGDLRENADYKAALERQEFVKIRLSNLQKRFSDLAMISLANIPEDEVALGSEVTMKNISTGEMRVIRLVLSEQFDSDRGYISVQSPMAKALLGKEEGDEVEVRTPQDIKRFEVVKVRTIHELDDVD